jgi:hypothetical protein
LEVAMPLQGKRLKLDEPLPPVRKTMWLVEWLKTYHAQSSYATSGEASET